ncbi:MAG: chemotaxis protein CheD [Deltaproteobacteria bacterium]|nr:chemotaxis protein CheD [Deltaproteobacteria bacterium]
MVNESNMPVSANYYLKPGYILVADRPTAISTVLGSCVSVCIYDRKRKTGGMNHFLLPTIMKSDAATARYGNVATLTLIVMLINDGSKVKNMEAQIFGGAYNSKISRLDVGQDNIKIARKVLRKKGVRIVSEDVGGEKGRKIVFDTSTNEVAVIKVDKLRKSDWHPYEGDR